MLGIRHYNRCALDLWVGLETDFYCDAFIWIGSPTTDHSITLDMTLSSSKEQLIQAKQALVTQLLKLEKKNIRHLAISWTKPIEIEASLPKILDTIKELLSEGQLGIHVRRITFILNDVNNYQNTQAQLFATFP